MINTIFRFSIYIYLGLQFAILFFIYLKGYNLKRSEFPKCLYMIFFLLAIFFIILGGLVIIKQFDKELNVILSGVIVVPAIPLIFVVHKFIKTSLPDRQK